MKTAFATVSARFVTCLSLLLLTLPAQAEGPEKSGDFFDKNFAETPLKKREGGRFPDGSFPTSKSGARGSSGLPNDVVTQEQIEKMMKDSQAGTWQKEMGITKPTVSPMGAEQQGDLTGLMRSLPVRSIGGIINSLDAAHYEKSIQQLTEFAAAKNLNIGTVYTIGDMRIASENPNIPKVISRGGVVRIVSNIPNGYEVNLSPTWIVKTDEGEILLEAVGSLDKYFNPAGEFLDREQRAPKKAVKAS